MSARLMVRALLFLTLYQWIAVFLADGVSAQGPEYTFCANESQRCIFSGTKDVAYGANGQFYYAFGVSGGIDCNDSVFGAPISGVNKACYIRSGLDLGPSSSDAPSAQLSPSTRNNLRRVLTPENFDTFMQLAGNVVNAGKCGADIVQAFRVTYPVTIPPVIVQFPADWPPETAEDCYDTAGQMFDFIWNKLVPPSGSQFVPPSSGSQRVPPSSPPNFSGTIVNNSDSNFYRAGTPKYWNESNRGVSGNFLWTRNNKSKADNSGTWKLPIPHASNYDVFVFVPSEHSSTTHATYEIKHSGKTDLFSVNQSSHHNEWLNVGTFDFDAKGSEYIRLTDSTGETDQTTEIAFDTVRFMLHQQSPIEKFFGDISRRVNEWIAAREKEIQQWAEQMVREQTEKFLRELGNLFVRWLRQSCGGGAILFFAPALALLWKRGRK